MAWRCVAALTGLPRLLKYSCRCCITPSLRSMSRLSSSAVDSRVRSSLVGPSPPETSTTSARCAASAMATRMTTPSGTIVCRATCTPRAASRWPIQAALVLMVSPRRSSVPVLTSSTIMQQAHPSCCAYFQRYSWCASWEALDHFSSFFSAAVTFPTVSNSSRMKGASTPGM